jgi:NitT/TauT family transport system ATP-binding protein
LTSAANAAIECRGLSLAYDGPNGRTIFEGLDLRVPLGQFVTVLGGSGVGKSTLLRIIAGLTAPSAGDVSALGRSVDHAPADVVMVFQDYSRSLLPWRTVLANATLGIERGTRRSEARRRGMEALEMVGLADCADLHPRQLSGGMQQRLQIARALATRPRIILMDEPFGALDAITKAGLQDQVRAIKAETQATFAFVTHDVDEAVYLGDRALVLAGSPAVLADDVMIDLGNRREQVATRASDDFLRLRARLHDALGHE